jgi:hypothetical protein
MRRLLVFDREAGAAVLVSRRGRGTAVYASNPKAPLVLLFQRSAPWCIEIHEPRRVVLVIPYRI